MDKSHVRDAYIAARDAPEGEKMTDKDCWNCQHVLELDGKLCRWAQFCFPSQFGNLLHRSLIDVYWQALEAAK